MSKQVLNPNHKMLDRFMDIMIVTCYAIDYWSILFGLKVRSFAITSVLSSATLYAGSQVQIVNQCPFCRTCVDLVLSFASSFWDRDFWPMKYRTDCDGLNLLCLHPLTVSRRLLLCPPRPRLPAWQLQQRVRVRPVRRCSTRQQA